MSKLKRVVRGNALNSLQKVFSTDYAKNEFSEIEKNQIPTRRKFIGDMAKAAAIISIPALYNACGPKNKNTQPTIAIIGGGIAGLHAAFIFI